MTRQKSLIGMELDCSFKTIEESQFYRLNHALEQPNLYLNHNAKKVIKWPFQHCFPTFLIGNLINLSTIYKTLSLNISNILLSRESIINPRPLIANESIKIQTFLRDAYEQQASSNPIGFIILESIGTIDKDLTFYCERVIAVRGGFQRGHA
jgi:hypothetical protein